MIMWKKLAFYASCLDNMNYKVNMGYVHKKEKLHDIPT